METTLKYKGKKTIISDFLFDKLIVKIDDPKRSNKFPSKSLYYDGKYYFFEQIITTENQTRIKNNTPFEIQAVYYSSKWYQDTFYITEDFKNFLLKFKY